MIYKRYILRQLHSKSQFPLSQISYQPNVLKHIHINYMELMHGTPLNPTFNAIQLHHYHVIMIKYYAQFRLMFQIPQCEKVLMQEVRVFIKVFLVIAFSHLQIIKINGNILPLSLFLLPNL